MTQEELLKLITGAKEATTTGEAVKLETDNGTSITLRISAKSIFANPNGLAWKFIRSVGLFKFCLAFIPKITSITLVDKDKVVNDVDIEAI